METRNNNPIPAWAVHPGEILREELKERGIKQKDFALSIGMQPTHLNEFICGKRDLNEELAIKLEKQLGIPYSSWMNLHNGYIYESKAVYARSAEEKEASEYEKKCDKIINIRLLYKRLGISSESSFERVRIIKNEFAFDILDTKELMSKVAGFYRHSEKAGIDERNMLTWLVLNWQKINNQHPWKKFSKGNAAKAAMEIAEMANARSIDIPAIRQCLQKYGISYLEVEKLEKAPIDAYSSTSNGHPVITVTYRFNDMDKLVFDILHELYHIDNHLPDNQTDFISIEGSEYSTDQREVDANTFARNTLIPEKTWQAILNAGCKSLNPHQIIKTIAVEASKRKISPSIAISRFKHDTNWYATPAYRSPKIFK